MGLGTKGLASGHMLQVRKCLVPTQFQRSTYRNRWLPMSSVAMVLGPWTIAEPWPASWLTARAMIGRNPQKGIGWIGDDN